MNDLSVFETNPFRKSWKMQAKLPSRMSDKTLADCKDINPAAMDVVKTWILMFNKGQIAADITSKSSGVGLLLCGAPGRGKTTLVAGIFNHLLATAPVKSFGDLDSEVVRRAARFITWNDYGRLASQAMKDDEADVELDRLSARDPRKGQWVRLLAIDDLGREHQSGSTWNSTLLHDLIRTRFNEGLPTIVTTNVEPSQVESFYGASTASFFKEALLTVPIIGKDLR